MSCELLVIHGELASLQVDVKYSKRLVDDIPTFAEVDATGPGCHTPREFAGSARNVPLVKQKINARVNQETILSQRDKVLLNFTLLAETT